MAPQRSRKAHLAKLAEARRIRREDKDDSPYTESIGKEDVDEDIPDEAINDFLAIDGRVRAFKTYQTKLIFYIAGSHQRRRKRGLCIGRP